MNGVGLAYRTVVQSWDLRKCNESLRLLPKLHNTVFEANSANNQHEY